MLSGLGFVFLRGNEDTWVCSDGAWVKHGNPAAEMPNIPCPKKEGRMHLTSPAFSGNAVIPAEYSCDGEGKSPPLIVSDVPPVAKSLVLVIDDPDAPNGTFHHLLVWNIGAAIKEIPENQIPNGAVVGSNSSGQAGYIAPCPPSGEHRYVFTLYALDVMVSLPAGSNRTELDQAIANHIVAETSLVGRYGRK